MTTPPGTIEVCCELCGEPLGFQSANTWVDPAMWRHTRCPQRLAEHWGITRAEVHALTDLLSAVIACCYPEIPSLKPLSSPGDRTLSKLRGDIAAGNVMEALAGQGYRVCHE